MCVGAHTLCKCDWCTQRTTYLPQLPLTGQHVGQGPSLQGVKPLQNTGTILKEWKSVDVSLDPWLLCMGHFLHSRTRAWERD